MSTNPPPESTSPAPRWRRSLAIALPLVLSFLVRLPVAGYDDTALANPDCLFQLHRAEQCLAAWPRVPSVDSFSHHPGGFRVHWPATHALFHASLAKAAGIEAGDRSALARLLSWYPPLLGVLATALVMLLARELSPRPAAPLVAGLLSALSGSGWMLFAHGAIDHHLFTHLGVLLLALGRLRGSLVSWVAGMLVAFLTAPASLLHVSLVFAVVAGVEVLALLARRGDRLARPYLFWLAPMPACALALLLDRLVQTNPPSLWELSWLAPSLFQVSWFLLVGVVAALLTGLLPRAERLRQRLLVTALVVVFAIVAAIGLLVATGETGRFRELLDRGERLSIGERASILEPLIDGRLGDLQGWDQLLVLLSIVLLARLLHLLWRRATARALVAAALPTAALLLGLVEYRHLRVQAGLVAAGLGVVLVDVAAGLLRQRFLAFRGAPALVSLGLGLLVAPPLLDFLWATRDTNTRLFLRDDARMEEVARWLREESPSPGPEGALHGGGAPDWAVFAPWDLGHRIHVRGERPVVTDPFNHVPRVQEAQRAVLRAGTAEELVTALEQYRARYLVLVNAPRLGLLELDHEIVDEGRPAPQLPGEWLYGESLQRFAAVRLFLDSALQPEFSRFRPRVLHPEDMPVPLLGADGEIRVREAPVAQLFELVRGAVLVGRAPAGAPVTLELTVERNGDPPRGRSVQWTLPPSFETRVSVAAPSEERSFRVPAPYVLYCEGWKAQVPVTDEDVSEGRRVIVSWRRSRAPPP